jgi:hypothetical protein
MSCDMLQILRLVRGTFADFDGDRLVPGHRYGTAHCNDYAANLNAVAASDAKAFCSALN